MHRLILLTGGLMAFSLVAGADVIDHTVTGKIAGRCEQLMVADVPVRCPSGGVEYRLGTRGTAVIVPLEDGREVVFQGRESTRLGPHDYTLILRTIFFAGDVGNIGTIIVRGPQGAVHDVAGECRVLMSSDGAIWHQVVCDARDAAGARYALLLHGDGSRAIFLLRRAPVDFPIIFDERRP